MNLKMNINIGSLKRLFRKKPNIDVVRDPHRDWYRILVGFVIGIIIICILDGYIFQLVSTGELAPYQDQDSVTTDTLDRAALKRVSDRYAAKDAALDALAKSKPAVVDPSR